VHVNHPARRAPWYLFAAGLVAFAIGDAIFNFYADVLHETPPVPSAADVFYLGGYPLIAAGLALLFLRFQPSDRRAGLIDAAVLTASFALAQWVFVMHKQIRGPGAASAKAVALAYPAMDVVLLSGLAVFFLSPAWRTASYRFLFASIVLLVLADEIDAAYSYSYVNTSWLDNGWLFSYVLWGVAALHPSMTALTEIRRPRRTRLSAPRLALLGGALLAAPVVLLLQKVTHERIEVYPIVAGATVLAVLVLARLGGIVRTLRQSQLEERSARSEADFARRQLEAQNQQLREADRLKDEFVALISHDLRTPLTSIMGYLELALDSEVVPEPERGYLEVVERNSERLLRLVNDLLFVARFEAGEMELNFSELDLAAIVRQAVEEATPRASAKQIALGVETERSLLVSADRGRMFQLLDNLIGNAIKFTPDGGRVDVRLLQRGDAVRLEVTDSGIGVTPDDQSHLFERFFRAANTRQGQVPGTGLGLYIARAIVEAHGGRIDVESSLGEGTRFCVDLPLVREPVLPRAEVVA
jgi:signal transduction histidine kinase